MNHLKIIVCFLIMFNFSLGQIEIILDNDQPNFSKQGTTWNLKTHADCYNGTGRYSKRGQGNNWAKWETAIIFPGAYHLDYWLINYKYASDAHAYVKTDTGDSAIIINEYYQPKGWSRLGTFNLTDNFTFKITDLFADTNATYVYIDALKLTYANPTYNLGGQVQTAITDTTSIIKVELYQSGTANLLIERILNPGNRQFTFENIPEGFYTIICSAWGYDTLTVEAVQLSGGDLTNLNLTLNRATLNRYTLTGSVQLDDHSNIKRCRIDVFPLVLSYPVAYDSIGDGEAFTFAELPAGSYRLRYSGAGYLTDSTTHANVNLDHNLNLPATTLYAFFQVAWITDSHIGAGTETAFTKVRDAINNRMADLDFLIHTGDMTERGSNSELADFKSYASGFRLPVYYVPGNHDTKWSESGLQTYINTFGSLHFSFNHKGFHFVGMNSGTPMKGGSGYFDPAEIQWLITDLANLPDPNMPIIFATHMPVDIGSCANYWSVLDILKRYRTAFILVGHGHSNQTHNFEGIDGAMSFDTYRADYPSGYNVLNISRKEIAISSCLNSTNLVSGATWFRKPFKAVIQPVIEFVNLNEDESLIGTRNIQITVSAPMNSGVYEIRSGGSGTPALSGSGMNWNFNLNTVSLENGSHVVMVTFTDATGQKYTCTREFYVANGYPRAVWRYDAGAIVIGTPAYDSSQVFFGTSAGKIHAVNRETGLPGWSPVQTDGAVFSSPCISDSTLYIGSSDGKLYAISTIDGSIRWTFNAGQAVICPVVAVDSLLYFAGSSKLYCLNLKTQQKVWEYVTGGLIESKPAILGEKIIVTSWDRNAHCVNRFTGTSIWRWNKQSSFYYAPAACWPVIGLDKVFVVDPMKNLTAINLATGATIWESGGTPQAWESIGISEDKTRVYIRSLDGNLYAFSGIATSKQQVWSSATDYGWDSTPSMPIEKNGAVLTGGKKGFIVSVAAHNGQVNWKYWVSQALVSTVNAIDGVMALAGSLDGSVALITGDPALANREEKPLLPLENQLLAAAPNPFNSNTKIRFILRELQTVRVTIYDLRGVPQFTWTQNNLPAGYHEILWNGRDATGRELASGVYLVRIQGRQFEQSRKIMYLK